MSVGGTIIAVIIEPQLVMVEIEDRVHKHRYWRQLKNNERTRCIGIGDSLWWQNHQGYWTPCQSSRQYGKDADVSVGPCWDCRAPAAPKL